MGGGGGRGSDLSSVDRGWGGSSDQTGLVWIGDGGGGGGVLIRLVLCGLGMGGGGGGE